MNVNGDFVTIINTIYDSLALIFAHGIALTYVFAFLATANIISSVLHQRWESRRYPIYITDCIVLTIIIETFVSRLFDIIRIDVY